MLKSIFLDMDETLCDTTSADKYAIEKLSQQLKKAYPKLDAKLFCQRYITGFYKRLNHEFPELVSLLLSDEKIFRQTLIKVLFAEQGIALTDENAAQIHSEFNVFRFEGFDFFPGVKAMLTRLRNQYKLIVITNGPTFSQRPKIDKVRLESFVDHILVGGEEPEEKPAASIFSKALTLANCNASEALHVGDSFACDIKGAANLGIASIWITSPTVQAENPEVGMASYVIYSAAEIEKTIQKHAQSLTTVN